MEMGLKGLIRKWVKDSLKGPQKKYKPSYMFLFYKEHAHCRLK